MHLIKCPMCGKEISPNAESCPNCGEPMKKGVSKNEFNKDTYNIVLVNGGGRRINVIHQIRTITGSSLKDAKDNFDNTPSIIIKNINHSKALDYKTLFEDLGAKIQIVLADQQNHQIDNEFAIKCSNCGSINIKKISGANKVGSAVLFGIFSVGKLTKTYQCNKCGYRW